MKKGYKLIDFTQRSINNILNRMGYTLKKVLKTKPLKKIPETDAIFDNIAQKHELAKNNPRILRISIDAKAKVKVGNLSKGGYSRMVKPPIADDHDHHWTDVLVPFGIHQVNTDDTFLVFGNSRETSDFVGDALELWWSEEQFNSSDFDLLMIDLDNGKAVASNTKLFMRRIVKFAQTINLPIRLVHYPPYHSKYNTVERFWAAVENYWRPMILDSVDRVLEVAKKVVYKGFNPIVRFIDKVYDKGIEVPANEVKELKEFIVRNPKLPLWDVLIKPSKDG